MQLELSKEQQREIALQWIKLMGTKRSSMFF
jgi:hypothetical protein